MYTDNYNTAGIGSRSANVLTQCKTVAPAGTVVWVSKILTHCKTVSPSGIGTRSANVLTQCKTVAPAGTVIWVSKYTDTLSNSFTYWECYIGQQIYRHSVKQ